MKQLICGSLNGMRIRQSLPQPYICGQERGSPGRDSGCELEFRDCGAARAAADCGETDRGDVRVETVVGNCLWRKARQPWKQGDPAESRIEGGAITIASLSTRASISSRTIDRLAHQMPDALN